MKPQLSRASCPNVNLHNLQILYSSTSCHREHTCTVVAMFGGTRHQIRQFTHATNTLARPSLGIPCGAVGASLRLNYYSQKAGCWSSEEGTINSIYNDEPGVDTTIHQSRVVRSLPLNKCAISISICRSLAFSSCLDPR